MRSPEESTYKDRTRNLTTWTSEISDTIRIYGTIYCMMELNTPLWQTTMVIQGDEGGKVRGWRRGAENRKRMKNTEVRELIN